MKWKCFKTRQQIIFERILELDNQMTFYSVDLDHAALTKDKKVMLKTLHDYECIQRAISRMYNLYSKKYDTP